MNGARERAAVEAAALEDQFQACMMQRQNLEAIFNSVADGIVALDLRLRISNLNRAAGQILGLAHEQAVGENCLEVVGPLDGELEAALRGRQRLDGHSLRLRGRHLLASTHVLRNEEGHEQGLVLILRDVTELESLRGELGERQRFAGLIGKNHRMREIYQLIEDLAESDATVLVLGESGTGKERVAEALHRHSHRRRGPLVRVNCSALSEGLLESELFGHVKGAFTGAIRDKVGRFEQASGGTIFLDEVGDLSPGVQVKLLRVLQERQIERVGSGRTLEVDVRVIAATHRDLRREMEAGHFREDLFYRLDVVPIEVPPLRQRRDDVPLLVAHFVERFNGRYTKRVQRVDEAAMGLLMDYEWPGNVRELENAMEHAFVKCRGEAILPECLPAHVRGARGPEGKGSQGEGGAEGLEREQVLRVLEECQWNRSRAAARLGMHRTTLWRKMREWGLQR